MNYCLVYDQMGTVCVGLVVEVVVFAALWVNSGLGFLDILMTFFYCFSAKRGQLQRFSQI